MVYFRGSLAIFVFWVVNLGSLWAPSSSGPWGSITTSLRQELSSVSQRALGFAVGLSWAQPGSLCCALCSPSSLWGSLALGFAQESAQELLSSLLHLHLSVFRACCKSQFSLLVMLPLAKVLHFEFWDLSPPLLTASVYHLHVRDGNTFQGFLQPFIPFFNLVNCAKVGFLQ